jgi:hypothetical protein
MERPGRESVCASGSSPTASRQRTGARSSSARPRNGTLLDFATGPYIVSRLAATSTARHRPVPLGRWLGRRMPRLEDARLLRGRGTFIADLDLPGALRGVRIVIARGSQPSTRSQRAVPRSRRSRRPTFRTTADRPALDRRRKARRRSPKACSVRWRAVALCSHRAAMKPRMEWTLSRSVRPLPCVVDAAAAAAGAPLLHEQLGSNVVYRGTRTIGDVESAFARLPTSSGRAGTIATSLRRSRRVAAASTSSTRAHVLELDAVSISCAGAWPWRRA